MSTVTINLRDFYPWYTHDEFVEVPDVIVAELMADRRYHKAHDRRMKRNKSYSFDVEADFETAALASDSDNPEVVFAMIDNLCRLCRALNSLPETQGRRIDAHYLQGISQTEIAKAEGVGVNSVNESIKRGLKSMKKSFQNNFENSPNKCP